MAIKKINQAGFEVINSKKGFFKKFDIFFNKKSLLVQMVKSHLKELNDSQNDVQRLVHKLNKKLVSNGKKISHLEQEYHVKNKQSRKLRELYEMIPKRIKELEDSMEKDVKQIDSLLKIDHKASFDLNKASGVLTAMEESIRNKEFSLKGFKKDLNELKKKRKLLDSFDWTKEELSQHNTEMSTFLRRETKIRKKQENKYKRERNKLNRMLNRTVRTEIIKFLDE